MGKIAQPIYSAWRRRWRSQVSEPVPHDDSIIFWKCFIGAVPEGKQKSSSIHKVGRQELEQQKIEVWMIHHWQWEVGRLWAACLSCEFAASAQGGSGPPCPNADTGLLRWNWLRLSAAPARLAASWAMFFKIFMAAAPVLSTTMGTNCTPWLRQASPVCR